MKPNVKIHSVGEPDSCSCCRSLRWGDEEGWDKCGKHGHNIYWPNKRKEVCDDFSKSELSDPRNAETSLRRCKKEISRLEMALEDERKKLKKIEDNLEEA